MTRVRRGPDVALLCTAMSARRGQLRPETWELPPKELKKPRDYLKSRGKWPTGPFEKDTPEDLDFYLEISKELRRLCNARKANTGQSVSDIATLAGLSAATVYNILDGSSWGELRTIYRLERELNSALWHHEHIGGP